MHWQKNVLEAHLPAHYALRSRWRPAGGVENFVLVVWHWGTPPGPSASFFTRMSCQLSPRIPLLNSWPTVIRWQVDWQLIQHYKYMPCVNYVHTVQTGIIALLQVYLEQTV